MRRQMKLIRLILQYLEDQPVFGDGDIPLPRFEKFGSVDVAYHVRLCSDAGYLILRKCTVETKPVILRMTWCGHKALEDLAR